MVHEIKLNNDPFMKIKGGIKAIEMRLYYERDIALPYDMEKYYSKEQQKLYGVVGIEIKLIKNT